MDARVAAMALRIRSGETLQAVGNDYGITRERVRQLVKKAGLTGRDGQRTRTSRAHTSRHAERDRRYLAKYGLTFFQYRDLAGPYGTISTRDDYYRSAIGAYTTQRNNARIRGIAWEFTLKTWWDTWQQSGKWEQRGRGAGKYHMSRPGDQGPYSPANVKIIPHEQNSTECRLNHPNNWFGRHRRPLGSGRGWQPHDSKTNPYQVIVRGKSYGSFPTQDAARARYLQVCAELNAQAALKRAA